MNGNPVSGGNGLVSRAKAMVLTPKTEWPIVEAEPSTVAEIYKSYVIWLAAIGPICSVIGQLVFGLPFVGVMFAISPSFIIASAIVSYVLGLVGVYVMALIINWLAPQFGGGSNMVQAFKAAAYSWTAAWLAGVFGIIPALAILGIVGLYSLYVLYLGLPVLMKVPQDKAVTYTVVSIVACIVIYWIIMTIAGTITMRLWMPTVVI